MSKKRTRRQKAIIRRRIFFSVCIVLLVSMIALLGTVVNFFIKSSHSTKADPPVSSDTAPVVSQEPKEPYVVSTATVLSIGDVMAHAPQIKGAYRPATGDYDFSAFFKETKSYFTAADLAAANLELTFGGPESGSYRGYPTFNTPDELADNIKDAGIGLLLTVNNHSYDTGLTGLKRTVSVLQEKGIPYTGTRQAPEEDKFLVRDVKGIKIGIAAFTYETTNANSAAGRKYLNGITLSTEANDLVNSFSYANIDAFYLTAEQMINDMKNRGAEFITFYMHWGEEYQLKANTWQKNIAQKLCNLGVDIIIGGHPHVVQPIELLTSEDGTRNTICVYSLGNAVSNQRRELISACRTGHTEDGLMFTYTLDKYSDGKVVLKAVDAIPTWVNRYSGGSGFLYTIYPLETEKFGSEKYGFTGENLNDTTQSYLRTKKTIAEGLTQCQQYLGCTVRFAEPQTDTTSTTTP